VGGGTVALRKVRTLFKSTHNITVISPDLCRELKQMLKQGKFVYKKAKYNKKFVKNAFLIIAATDDNEVNAQIVADANRLGKLVNVVDVPHQCNFYLPSVINKKGILLSISTQGAFPGLAKKIRQNAQAMIEKYADSLSVLSKLREQIKKNCQDNRKKRILMNKLLDDKVLSLIKSKKICSFKDLEKCIKVK
jgi:precorrin-2 dehydrogenase/sirohydrochlorin ferrochelatase